MRYLYSYDGAKIKVQDANNANGYDYLGSLVLVKTNNTITPECHFGEGIIRGSKVMYFEKDHLGSTRTVMNTSGTVLEKNDYYPFGLRHANSSYVITANNRYKFNGKEDQTVGSLGLLDYEARMYDGHTGSVKTKKDSHTFIIDYQNTNDPVLFWLDLNLGFGEIKNSDIKIREKSEKGWSHRHKGPIGSGEDFWIELQKVIDEIVKNQ